MMFIKRSFRQDPYSRQQCFVQTKLVTQSGSINCFSASDYFIFGARPDTCLQIVKLPFSVLCPLSSLSTSQGPPESDLSSSSPLQSSWSIWCLTGELWGDLCFNPSHFYKVIFLRGNTYSVKRKSSVLQTPASKKHEVWVKLSLFVIGWASFLTLHPHHLTNICSEWGQGKGRNFNSTLTTGPLYC